MNIIDIIICVILGLSLVSGMYKGFLTSALSIAAFAGSWFGAYKLFPRLTALVSGNAAIMDSMRSVFDAGEMFATSSLGSLKVADAGAESLAQAVSEINIPIVKDMFGANMASRAFESLGIASISEYLTETLLVAVLNVVAFIAAFIVLYFVATLLVNLISSVFRFAQLKHFDWFLGGVLGAARGIVILMLLFAVVPTALSTLESLGVKTLDTLITDSKFAAYFTNSNFITNAVGQFIESVMN